MQPTHVLSPTVEPPLPLLQLRAASPLPRWCASRRRAWHAADEQATATPCPHEKVRRPRLHGRGDEAQRLPVRHDQIRRTVQACGGKGAQREPSMSYSIYHM